MCAFVLSSYQNGPLLGGAGNRTGSDGGIANCSTGGCHATNTSNTQVTLAITTTAGVPITEYTPGTTYKITVAGTNNTGLPKFGFQASCVKTGTHTQAGSFSATGSISVRTTSSSTPLQIVEHNSPIAGVVTGTTAGYIATFTWTAPPTGTGSVSFYATLNAVNNNGNDVGDQPNTLSSPVALPEAATSVRNVSLQSISIYPNPASNIIRMELNGSGTNCAVQIHDISGRIVAIQNVAVNNGEAIIQIENIKPGNYYIIASHAGERYLAPFVKY